MSTPSPQIHSGTGPATATVRFEAPSRKRVWLGVILCCTVLVAYLDRVNVSVLIAAPGFLQEMGLKNNPVGQGLLMSLFLMAYGIGNVVLGPVADRLGPRKAMSVALFSWTIPMAAGALTRTLSVLYASRLVLGAGEAMHYPMQSSFVKNWYPREERAKANAAWLFGQMIGPGLAMPLFAWVIAAFGWRASFWLCAFLGMVILPVIWFGTRDLPEQHKGVNQAELEHILQGRALTAEGTGKTMQARSVLQNYGILLKNPDFICCSLTYWASNTMWWGMMSWMPQYLKVARGFSWTKMGFFSALPFFVGLLGLISSGVVSDKLRRAAPLNCIGLAGCATFIGLGAIVHNNNLSAYLLACAFFFKGVSTPMAWTLLQTFVPSRMIGQAAGLQNGSSNLIGALSPLAVGFLIAVTGTYTAGLFYMVGFGLFGAAVGLYLVAKKY